MTARAGEDLALIQRFVGGDRSAFDVLVRAHEDRVFSICLRVMANREAALDATQETFLTLYRKADRFTGTASFSTWLYRVAVNTCYDLLRKEKRRKADPLPEHHDPADATAADGFTSVELRPDLNRALSLLPDEFRAAVILSDLEDLPIAEIAEVLDIPAGTAKSRIFRGRRLLAQILRNHEGLTERPRNDQDA
ncbi:MAG: sigma-70 family RNA polymerase sigma factor [Acidimicrobiia bacterium]|nr:sigma-70 family RNA polymerase sigma factor [Acidimicrobiia bacterium]